MKQKLNPNQEVITVEEKLSVEELEKCSRRLADLVGEHDDIKAEKSGVMKSFNDRLKQLESAMSIVAQEVHTAVRKTQTLVTKKENRAEGVIEFVAENGTVVKREQLLLGPGAQLHIEDAVIVDESKCGGNCQESGVVCEDPDCPFFVNDEVEAEEVE